MPWPFRSASRRKPPADDGALYRRIPEGAALEFDPFEERSINAAVAEANEANQRLLDLLPGKGTNIPGLADALAGYAARCRATHSGLMAAAQQRYELEDFASAANTCVKAGLVAGLVAESSQSKDKWGMCAPWLLMARIHASAGRFRTAASMLEDARTAYATDPACQGLSEPFGEELAAVSRRMWTDAFASLDADIRALRRPRPGSYLGATSRSGWYDS